MLKRCKVKFQNIILKYKVSLDYTFLKKKKSNQGQASALKVAHIFKVFGAQSCLMVAQYFDQETLCLREIQ